MSRVALVLVSHSAEVASGTAQIAAQMAPDVLVLPAGGIPEGIGTSFDRVLEAVEEGLAVAGSDGGGVVVLTDLGSAVLTTDAVLEMLDDEQAAMVRVPSAPFVEGAVAASVRAQQGGDLAAVEAAALEAGAVWAPAVAPAVQAPVGGVAADAVSAVVTLRNPHGLHARPAALLARVVSEAGTPVTVNGVDGASMLALMTLKVHQGSEVTIAAAGPLARRAVDSVVAAIEEGLGEA